MKKATLIGLGVLLGAAAMFVLVQTGDLFAQEGPWGGDRPGGRGFPRMPRGGGGSVAMTTVGKHLFIVSESTLFKIDPEAMKIVKTLELKPERPEKPERNDRPGSGRKGW